MDLRLFIALLVLAVFVLGCTSQDVVNITKPETHVSKPPQLNISVSNTTAVVPNNAISEPVNFCKKVMLTNSNTTKRYLYFHDNKISWFDDMGQNSQLSILDIDKNVTHTIFNSLDNPISLNHPSFEDAIVLRGVEVFNLTSNKTEKYNPPGSESKKDANIWNDMVVFSQEQFTAYEVYYVNLSEEPEIHAHRVYAETAVDNRLPKIYSNIIVWQAYNVHTGMSKILLYNLSERGNETVYQFIFNGKFAYTFYVEYLPKIVELASGNVEGQELYSNNVVWQGMTGSNWNIYYYDALSNKTVKITKDSFNHTNPKVSSSYIIWEDYRNGNWDIYAYDFTKQKEIQLVTDSSNQTEAAIFSNRVVWIENNQIYTCLIENN